MLPHINYLDWEKWGLRGPERRRGREDGFWKRSGLRKKEAQKEEGEDRGSGGRF